MTVATTPLSPAEQRAISIEMIGRAAAAGLVVEVDPDLADVMAAFDEPALDAGEADASRLDAISEEIV